jgi:HK97 family phage prohead protease
MKEQLERRFHPGEVRVERSEGRTKIAGYAAVFNSLSENLGWFREQINPGFFAEAVGRDDVRGLFNHDPNYVLGRSTSGTLKLEEDSQGLRMEVDPPDTQWAKDLVATIDRRDVTGQSFSFTTMEDAWGEDAAGNIIRTLIRIGRLGDVGP